MKTEPFSDDVVGPAGLGLSHEFNPLGVLTSPNADIDSTRHYSRCPNRFVAVFALIVGVSASLAAPALSHEYTRADGTAVDASWIQEKHVWCCGKFDCRPVAPAQVVFTPRGWKVQGLNGVIRVDEVRDSEGRGPWACDNRVEGQPDHIRCLFLPGIRG